MLAFFCFMLPAKVILFVASCVALLCFQNFILLLNPPRFTKPQYHARLPLQGGDVLEG